MKRFDKILRISYHKDALKFKLKRLSQSFACIVAVPLRAARASVVLYVRRAGLQKIAGLFAAKSSAVPAEPY